MVGGLGPPCWGAPPCSWYGPARDVGDMGIVVGVESDSSDRLSARPRGAFWGGLGGGGGPPGRGGGRGGAPGGRAGGGGDPPRPGRDPGQLPRSMAARRRHLPQASCRLLRVWVISGLCYKYEQRRSGGGKENEGREGRVRA